MALSIMGMTSINDLDITGVEYHEDVEIAYIYHERGFVRISKGENTIAFKSMEGALLDADTLKEREYETIIRDLVMGGYILN